MTIIPDPLRDIEAACDLLRKRIAEQQARIERLERENQKLREERESYWKLCGDILREDISRNEAAWEQDLREGLKTAVPFDKVLEEIERRMTGVSRE